jgi:exopolyphosphatase / guanosine-5'-triphosphate,3'-diphosphate pyrophosphatase
LTNAGASSVEHGELRGSDLEAVREQLGREPTIPFTVVARCAGGHPLVIRDAPLDADGSPFPTTYWLTCPDAVREVSRLESDGAIGRLNERYDTDAAFRARVDAAHDEAAADRGRDLPDAGTWGGVGGTRRGVKCLHAHYANHVAGGDDVVGRWVVERIEPIHPEQRGGRVAAIDQGTNSCRFTVVEPAADPSDEPTELARDMVITRLGQGVDRTGRLDPDALARTLAVIARYCRRARALGAERIRVGATSATRDATNRQELADVVRELAGSDLDVISGEREAALSFLGGTRGLDPGDGPFLVLDIGGGSTEFVVGVRPGVAEDASSVRMGSVRLTERAVRSDPPTPEDLGRLRELVAAGIDEASRAIPVGRARTFVSVAGTATTLQAIALGLGRYDPERIHRTWLHAAEAERVLDALAAMTNEERAAIPVMAPGRGDVIVAGGLILVEVMRRLGLDRTLVSETDILDGLAFEMLDVR